MIPPNFSGYVTDPERNQALWNRRSRNVLVARVRRSDATEALAVYWIRDDVLSVRSLHWRSLLGRRELLSFLSAYRDQVHTIRFENLPLGLNLHAWLHDLRESLDAKLTRAPMVRVMDPVGAITGLRVSTAGSLLFRLDDAQCEWSSGVYRLASDGDPLEARRSGGSPELRMSVQGLTSLVFGVLDHAEVEHRGWITGLSENDRRLLSDWFPPRHFFNPYTF